MIHWLTQPSTALPADAAAFLSPAEAATYAALKMPKRRSDWLLGRFTAKQLVAEYLGGMGSVSGTANEARLLRNIVIAADADGAPYVTLGGARLPATLSISHSHGMAFCAIEETLEGQTVGCDIEYIEPRDPAFLRDFFTPAEQAAAQAWPQPDVATTLLWSGKEAVLKALREGLRVDTKQVQIALPAALLAAPDKRWAPLGVTLAPALAQRFPGAWAGWASRQGDFVLTMALHTQSQEPARRRKERNSS